MSSIYELIMQELADRSVYKAETYAPYYICSHAMHMFNLMNAQREIYWEAKRLPNMRAHLLFVAPPGWMKSYYLQQMGGDTFGVYRRVDVDIGYEQYMTEAGFVGTITQAGGNIMPVEGAAKIYDKGILMIDEFSAITEVLQSKHSNMMDTQLLSALDHGHVMKRLGMGKLEYDTRLTLWAGVQPARFDVTSGMGRRLIYMVFIPTKADNEYLLDTMHEARNMRPDAAKMGSVWDKIKQFRLDMNLIETVEFDDSILALYKELGLFSFEGSYFDRLILGYHLAQYGPEKKLTISMKGDKELRTLLEREKKWRQQISMGIEFVQLLKIIELAGNSISRKDLIRDAAMYGWNASQVLEMIDEARKNQMLTFNRGLVELVV